MGKNKKPKCVMILTEGPSDRAALTAFFTDLYAMIDEDIEVFFPFFREESLVDNSVNYNGDVTSRNGIDPNNILPMLLKLFIHPEFKKHPAYEYPKSVVEVIHLVDIDGAFVNDEQVIDAKEGDDRKLPYYDTINQTIVAKKREDIVDRNERKQKNIAKLVETKALRITINEDQKGDKERPYKIFYFSSNLDHVLFGKANNISGNKVPDARNFSNDFYDESLKLARYLLDHPCAVKDMSYEESWDFIKNHSLDAYTNINILVSELLKRAKISVNDLPINDIRSYDVE